jgi:hypothetical protein
LKKVKLLKNKIEKVAEKKGTVEIKNNDDY